jgi:hypothetical protein
MIVTNDFCRRLLPVETVCGKMQAKKHSKVFVIGLISSIIFKVCEKMQEKTQQNIIINN